MLQELVCHHVEKGSKRYLRLTRTIYRIGKSLDNDIVLLEAAVPPFLGTLENKNGVYVWSSSQIECSGYVFTVRNYKIWLRTLSFVVVFLCSFTFFEHFNAFNLTQNFKKTTLPARGVFGNVNSKKPVQSLKFEFQTHQGRYPVLHYTPGNLNGNQDLQIQINGKFLAFVPASPNRWNVEQTQFIPKGILVNTINVVEFVFLNQTPNSWGIRDVYIDETSEAPAVLSGAELIKNAKKLLSERNVKKGNLVRAEQLAKQAGQFYYSKKQNYPQTLQNLIEKIRAEKVQMINDYQVLIQKYRQQGDKKKESRMFKKLMDELIDPVDPDRNQVLRDREGSA